MTTPRVPSLPTNSLSSDSPATSLIRLPPSVHQRAVGEHDVEAEHVVGGDAVLHAAEPAGVGGDVAADRADLVRRRVGRVPEPVLRGGRLDLGVERARLDDRDLAVGVDLDRAHPLQAEHDAAVDRARPAGQPAAGAARARPARRGRPPSAPRPAPARRPRRGPPRPGCRRAVSWDLSKRYFSMVSGSVTTTPSGRAPISWRGRCHAHRAAMRATATTPGRTHVVEAPTAPRRRGRCAELAPDQRAA